MTVVSQWAKAPGVHGYVAGSIPGVTPRYYIYYYNKMFFRAPKQEEEKGFELTSQQRKHSHGQPRLFW
jgi:hypothetical protein